MELSHKIELRSTPEQVTYFEKASGTSRFVWNWALAEWNRQKEAGQKPNAMALKKQFNALKYQQFPWMRDIHRDAHAQPFTYLDKAWKRFFSEIKAGKPAHEPRFKKKGRCTDSFYIANDKFSLQEQTIRLPKMGEVLMTETLRFEGKILGATVSRRADRWFVSLQVKVPDEKALKPRTGEEITGVDLGLKSAVTLSSGETLESPKPLKSALRRLQIRGRRVSRKFEAAKQQAGFGKRAKLPKGTRIEASRNQKKASLQVAKLHARISRLRADFTHKLTTRLCRENQTVVIEDLNVKGMLANDKLARSISDIGFGEIRRQLEYKSSRFGTRLIIADRWFPSSRLCSQCGWKNETLTLKDREWDCPQCGATHDRDLNAALNLRRLATETALPVASSLVTKNTPTGMGSVRVGKVTPVRYEGSQQDSSGQEINRAHFSALF